MATDNSAGPFGFLDLWCGIVLGSIMVMLCILETRAGISTKTEPHAGQRGGWKEHGLWHPSTSRPIDGQTSQNPANYRVLRGPSIAPPVDRAPYYAMLLPVLGPRLPEPVLGRLGPKPKVTSMAPNHIDLYNLVTAMAAIHVNLFFRFGAFRLGLSKTNGLVAKCCAAPILGLKGLDKNTRNDA